MVTIKGKPKILARHAVGAWQIMEGENALVLVAPKKKEQPYLLRFYDGDTRKYLVLGDLPFAATELIQAKQSNEHWAFGLSGTYLGKPTIVIAGVNGVHGMLQNASQPKFHEDSLTFLDANGNPKTLPVQPLLATDMTGIYEVTARGSEKIRYAQFLRTGVAVLVSPDGSYHNAIWRTNGEAMIVTDTDKSEVRWPRESLKPVMGVPAGTRLCVRLLEPIGSEAIKDGDPIEGVLISTATVNDDVLLPQGTIFNGNIVDAHGVGWGIRHETAAITLTFSSAKTPDGLVIPIFTQLSDVENTRETITDKGKIQGVRSSGTPAYSVENKIASIAAFDPVAYLFTNTASRATLGFADPEIRYPAGTELIVQFLAPVVTSKTYPRQVPEFTGTVEEREKLYQMVKDLPFRTATKTTKKPSDITNLVFIGPPEGLRRAFQAAGWVVVDSLSAGSAFMTIKTVGGNQVYNQAPMSTLLLDGRAPILTLTKTTNTFNSRHHLRVFDPGVKFDGETVLTSSSTQDIRVAVSAKQKTFIHVIDEYIDNERSKVVNDLEFTGCVEAMNLIPRPWVPQDAYNSTGDRLRTDGAAAVIRISDCKDPRTTTPTPAKQPNRFKRGTRNTILVLRDDIYRGNLVYSGISGFLWATKYFSTRDQLTPYSGAWRTTDQSGTQFKGFGNDPTDRQTSDNIYRPDDKSQEVLEAEAKDLERSHRWDPPRVEIGLQGGYLRYPTIRNEVVLLTANPDDGDPNKIYQTLLADEFDGGWTAGIQVTLNSWKWFSNQFVYSYSRGKFQFLGLFTKPDTLVIQGSSGLVTRQFEYSLMFNLRPPTSRWRPYVTAGPALVLTSLSEAPLKKAAGPFKLGLQNVGLLLAAFDFGGTAPLNGGGVFAPGIVYGTGVKVRVHPRITLSVDFRETLSKGPDFLSDSYTSEFFSEDGFTLTKEKFTTDAKYRQQRFTGGIAFTF